MNILLTIVLQPIEWVLLAIWAMGAFLMFIALIDIIESHYRMYKERRG